MSQLPLVYFSHLKVKISVFTLWERGPTSPKSSPDYFSVLQVVTGRRYFSGGNVIVISGIPFDLKVSVTGSHHFSREEPTVVFGSLHSHKVEVNRLYYVMCEGEEDLVTVLFVDFVFRIYSGYRIRTKLLCLLF